MKKILLFLIMILITSFKSINAGSGTAHLTCKSESGRTLFKADIQDIDGIIEKAELTIDGVKSDFSDSENSSIIFDSKNGVYAIVLKSSSDNDFSGHKFLKFWAVPKRFKTIKENNTRVKYAFKARLYSTEPREGKSLQTPIIEVQCTLEYEI